MRAYGIPASHNIRKLLSYLKQHATIWAGRNHQRENKLFRTPPHFFPSCWEGMLFPSQKTFNETVSSCLLYILNLEFASNNQENLKFMQIVLPIKLAMHCTVAYQHSATIQQCVEQAQSKTSSQECYCQKTIHHFSMK